MQPIHGRPFGLWHVSMWLAAAGFVAPAVAATMAPLPAAAADSAAVAPVADAATSDNDNDNDNDNANANANASLPHRLTAALSARLPMMRSDGPHASGEAGDWPRVDDGDLDAARGGFANDRGLMVSLGVDRLVSVNGEVLAHSRLDIADLGRIDAGQASQASTLLSSVKLVQIGGENIYRAGELGAALGGVIVQNSLDNQLIRTETVIHSTVNSAGLLNTLNFHGTLHDALARAVGQP